MNSSKPHPLQEYLNTHNMTQVQMAKELGVARQYICNMIAGKRASPRMALQIEKLTGGKVSAQALMHPEGSLPLAQARRQAA
jgi:plasmid maintenance system antidote protein VapI